MKLTATTIKSLTLPRGVKERIYFDSELPGFGLRIRAGGSRVWVAQFKVGRRVRRIKLGTSPALDPGKARAEAKQILAAVHLGRDPATEKQDLRAAAAETIGSLLPAYLEHRRGMLKPRSFVEVERHLTRDARSLHARPVADVDRRAIAVLLAEITKDNSARVAGAVRASLSRFFTWALREGLIETNPVSFTNRPPAAEPRIRVLSDPELAAIWHAAGDGHYGAIVRLLMLTGARRDEIASLRWSEIDLGEVLVSLPGSRTKSGVEQQIPLTVPALEILAGQPRRTTSDGESRDLIFGYGQGGFALWSKSKMELDARLAPPIADWRLHDFRRSLSTAMHERLGVAPWIVESVLGHIAGYKAGVAGVYNRALYLEQKTAALTAWADHLMTVVAGADTNVTTTTAAPPVTDYTALFGARRRR